jgi:hypothetical protein
MCELPLPTLACHEHRPARSWRARSGDQPGGGHVEIFIGNIVEIAAGIGLLWWVNRRNPGTFVRRKPTPRTKWNSDRTGVRAKSASARSCGRDGAPCLKGSLRLPLRQTAQMPYPRIRSAADTTEREPALPSGTGRTLMPMCERTGVQIPKPWRRRQATGTTEPRALRLDCAAASAGAIMGCGRRLPYSRPGHLE